MTPVRCVGEHCGKLTTNYYYVYRCTEPLKRGKAIQPMRRVPLCRNCFEDDLRRESRDLSGRAAQKGVPMISVFASIVAACLIAITAAACFALICLGMFLFSKADQTRNHIRLINGPLPPGYRKSA